MRRIAQILILAFVAILVIPIFLPDKVEATVERSFEAPASVIFESFNNLNKFSKWESWASPDSLSVQEFFSPYKGKGAGYQWQSNNDKGILTITESIKNLKIHYRIEGFGLGKDSEMTIELVQTDSVNTMIKWNIVSKEINYFSRYYSYFTSDNLKRKMNEGLNRLEKFLKNPPITEKQTESLQPNIISIEQFEGQKLISVLNETTLDNEEIVTAIEESLGLIYSYLTDFLKFSRNEIGNPIVYYDFIDTSAKKAKFHIGYPIDESVKIGEGMEVILIPASKALIYTHRGSYSTIEQSISQMNAYAKTKNLKIEKSFWEEFLNKPKEIKNQKKLLTKIYIPVKE